MQLYKLCRYGTAVLGTWHETVDVKGDVGGGSVQVVEIEEDDKGIMEITGYHQTRSGCLLGLGVSTWSGKKFGFGEIGGIAGDKYTWYRGSQRGHKLAFLSSGTENGRVSINFHWDNKD